MPARRKAWACSRAQVPMVVLLAVDHKLEVDIENIHPVVEGNRIVVVEVGNIVVEEADIEEVDIDSLLLVTSDE